MRTILNKNISKVKQMRIVLINGIFMTVAAITCASQTSEQKGSDIPTAGDGGLAIRESQCL